MAASIRRSPRGHRRLVAAVAVSLLGVQLVTATPALAVGGSLSVGNGSGIEPPNPGGRATVTLTVTLNRTAPGPVNVDYRTVDGTAKAGQDYLARTGSLLFAASGDEQKDVTVTILGDDVHEGDETFTLEILNPHNAEITQATGTGTIVDGDERPTVSIADTAADEGNSGTGPALFVVTLSKPSGLPVTVNHTTANGTASQPADYTSTNGTLSFDPGVTSRIVSVPVVGDVVDEADETFTVTLSGAVNATLADASADGIIVDDDGPPTVSIGDATVTEGSGPAAFTIRLSGAETQKSVVVGVATANGTATAPGDYTAKTQQITFAPGEREKTFGVTIANDNVAENDETFLARITSSPDAAVGVDFATGTIHDDDVPQFSINDVAPKPEGTATLLAPGPTPFTFTVTRSGATGATSVAYAVGVEGDTATAPGDYTSASGVVMFNAGQTTRPVTVNVVADALPEFTETFRVKLSAVPGTTVAIVRGEGLGTILNDDGPPATVRIDDVRVQEGTGGSTTAVFRVRVDAGFAQPVTVTYATKDGTAVVSQDYSATTGSLVFTGGKTEDFISVSVVPDALDEDDETFTVELTSAQNAQISRGAATGTIADDDAAPVLHVANLSVSEGNRGPSRGQVQISLSAPSGKTVTVNHATADGTARRADNDYAAPATGTVTFLPGQVTRMVEVAAIGDNRD